MAGHVTNIEKRRKLPWALAGDAATVAYVYLTFSGPIFLLFLDKIGLDKSRIGLILSLVPFCGLLALFAAPIAGRVGYRKIFLWFWTARKFVLALIMLCPWVIHQYGTDACFKFVAAVMLLFAMIRAVAASSFSVWSSEFVPTNIRGKFSAIQSIIVLLVGAAVVAIAGKVVGPEAEPSRFLILFAVAFVLGVVGCWTYSRLPGGEPDGGGPGGLLSLREMAAPLKDKGFRQFLIGAALVSLGILPLMSFLPLFMKEYVGLSADRVIQLEAMQMLGGLCMSLFWGWAADRYGGRPVMVTCLAGLLVFPLGLMIMPRQAEAAGHLAMVLYFVYGAILPGYNVGYMRYLYVRMIPPERKASYVAVHWSIVGIFGGLSPILAGQFLQQVEGLHETFGFLTIDAYTPLMATFFVCVGLAAVVMARAPRDSKTDVSRFALLFLQGSPVMAIQALLAYQLAGDESRRVVTIEKLGHSRSPLSVNELIAALDDPSFNVRYEAIVSIARTRSDPHLTEALVRVLHEADPDLRTTAAWALGRLKAREAAPDLRQGLESDYLLLRARCARALGMMRDAESVPLILDAFGSETDKGIRVAYAASLSSLRAAQALPMILALLRQLEDQAARGETSLSVARLLGGSEPAQRLWRRMINEPGDTLGGVMLGLQRKAKLYAETYDAWLGLDDVIGRCANQLGSEQFNDGAQTLLRIARDVPENALTPVARDVLLDAVDAIGHYGADRMEYLCLAVHALHVGILES